MWFFALKQLVFLIDCISAWLPLQSQRKLAWRYCSMVRGNYREKKITQEGSFMKNIYTSYEQKLQSWALLYNLYNLISALEFSPTPSQGHLKPSQQSDLSKIKQ